MADEGNTTKQCTYNVTSWCVRVTIVAMFPFIVVDVHAAVNNIKCSALPWKYSNVSRSL